MLPPSVQSRVGRFFLAPVLDLRAAFTRALPERPWPGIAAIFVGFAISGWVYVPVHELLHAFGCMAFGGTVDRLEIDPLYGSALLQRVFPFVAVGSEYAGQLTEFDTRGSDLIYLATVFAPFLLTILLGVWLLRAVSRFRRPGILPCLLLGASTPHAFAPFVNVAGDFYEIGSIFSSRVVALFDPGLSIEAWRSDDLIRTASRLLESDSAGPGDAVVLVLGSLLGAVLTFATYQAGGAFSDLVTRRRGHRD
jgi:hypothetical protein